MAVNLTTTNQVPHHQLAQLAQQAVRPAGLIRGQSQPVNEGLTTISPEITQNIPFSPEELISISCMVTPTPLTDQQAELTQDLNRYYSKIVHPQFNPLKLLFIDIVTLIIKCQNANQSKCKPSAQNQLNKAQKEYAKSLECDACFEIEHICFLKFNYFNTYFNTHDRTRVVDFIEFLEMLYKISENFETPHLKPYKKSLQLKLQLLIDCLKNKDLFPLILKPQIGSKPPLFFNKEMINLFNNTLKLLYAGVEGLDRYHQEVIKNVPSEISKTPGFQSLKKTLKSSINKLQKAIERLKLSSFVMHPASCQKYDSLDPDAFTHLYQHFKIVIEEGSGFISSYYESVNNIKSQWKIFAEKVTTSHQSLYESFHKNWTMVFDFCVRDNLLPLHILIRDLKLKQQAIEKQYDETKKLNEPLVKKKQKGLNSYFLNESDCFFLNLGLEITKLYQYTTNRKTIKTIGDLSYCCGELQTTLLQLIKSRPFNSGKEEVITHLVRLTQALLGKNGELDLLNTKFAENTLAQKSLSQIQCYLKELYNFISKFDTHCWHAISITRRLGNNQSCDSQLLNILNTQFKYTKAFITHLSLDNYKTIDQKILSPFDYEKQSIDPIYKESFNRNLKIIENVIVLHNKTHEFKDEQTALLFANELIKFSEQYTYIKEITSQLNTFGDLKNIYLDSSPGLLEFPEQQQNEIIERTIKEINDFYFIFPLCILLPHQSLIEWAMVQSDPAPPKESATKGTKKTSAQKKPILPQPQKIASEIIPENSKAAPRLTPFETINCLRQDIHTAFASIKSNPPLITDALTKTEALNRIELIENHYLPILDELLEIDLETNTYYAKESVLLYSTLLLEAILKIRIASTKPSKYAPISSSHDLVKLTALLDIPLSEDEQKHLEEGKKVAPVTSRYLWKNEGILPEHFRASMTESPPHIDQILPYLTTFFQIASNELQKEARLNLQSLEKTQTSILDTSFKSHPHLIEKVAPYSLSIERKCKTFKQLVYRPVALDQISGTQSLLIRTAVHNIPFYLTGMRQILPSFFSNRYSYPQISFTLQKVTLLLEQSLKVAIGRLGDEVIQSESGRNIVCEHQLDNLNAHLEKSIPEEGLSLTESEEKTLFTLRRFLFAEGRYLSTYSQDNLGKTLVSIRDKCHNLQRYRKGFYTPVEEKEFKARFGSKQETWMIEIEKELESLINAEIYPLVFDALAISEKLLDLSL